MDNPVYYVQYAHARICSVERKAAEAGLDLPALAANAAFLERLGEEAELALLRKLDAFPELVASAAAGLAPHHVSYYLMELARDLHGYYSSFQVLNQEDKELAAARL